MYDALKCQFGSLILLKFNGLAELGHAPAVLEHVPAGRGRRETGFASRLLSLGTN
jgi:hypothetical protein